jgi:hypothetical protein
MAEEMGAFAHGMEPGSLQRSVYERTDRLAVGKSTVRGPHPDKDLPCGARGSACTEVGGSCLADGVWQRESIVAGTLAPDAQFPNGPIQIIQAQGGHFPGP